MSSVYDYSATLANGTETSLSDYKGQVLLVVNTASKCGFTPQYEGLEKLYRDHKEAGFSVLAFPCNQFGAQEPGSTEDIVEFCEMRFQTSFPLFEKIEVNGDGTHPLYQHLKSSVKGTWELNASNGTSRSFWLIERVRSLLASGLRKNPQTLSRKSKHCYNRRSTRDPARSVTPVLVRRESQCSRVALN